VALTQASDMINDTVAVQYESPLFQGYPVTIVTANDGERLLAGVNALQDRRIWDRLAGDLAVWNADPDSLAVGKVGPDFIFKARGPLVRVSSRFDRQPWLVAIVLLGVLLLLGLLVRGMLRRRELRRGGE
jgi:hypothetical protein